MTKRKFFSALMCLCLMASVLTGVAYAAPEDGICPHHTAHDPEVCGYVAAQAEVPCGHVCSVELGCTAATAEQPCTDVHTHDGTCGYADAVAAVCVHAHDGTCGYADAVAPICVHAHDGACGYTADIPGTPCNHACDIDEGCQYMGYCTHVHDAYCNYTEGTSGTPCTHVCAVETGCTLAAAAQPCTHVCAAETGCTLAAAAQPCTYVHTHNELCGYAPAQADVCAHTVHDSVCGYSAAVAEIPCTFATTCTDCNPFLKAVITVGSAGSYDGTAKTPTVTVTIDGTTLVENTDYTLSYSNNVNAGEATVSITGIGTYSGQSTSAKFTIAPALLEIVAGNLTKVYGEADPALTYTVEGLVDPDTEASVLTGALARAPGENVGSYKILGGSLSIASGVTNYKIKNFTQGTMSISAKPVTVTAGDQTVIYGSALDQTLATATGLLDGHKLYSATLTPSSADVTADGKITATDATIYDASDNNVTDNYEITYTDGKLVVNAKELSPTIELSPNRYAYTGKACTPKVKLMDGSRVIPDTEYTVTYTNNVSIGTATAAVTDKEGGNYIIKPVSAPFSIVQQQVYTIINGNGQTYTSANYYGMSFVTNGPAANLVGVFIDNQAVNNSFYSVAPYTNAAYGINGSTITLSTNLMNLVSTGTHTVIFKYSDGQAAGTFIKGSSTINGVRTGDDSNIGLLTALMCLGLMGSTAILPAFRKQKNR